jgi:Protein of unknown function (DUF3574)
VVKGVNTVTFDAWFGLIDALKPSRTLLALLAGVCLYNAGCVTSTVSKSVGGAGVHPTAQWLRTELYMAVVDAEKWREFLANNVTPKFPDGFTVLDAYGQWRNPRGEIHVIPSRMLVVLHPATSASTGPSAKRRASPWADRWEITCSTT